MWAIFAVLFGAATAQNVFSTPRPASSQPIASSFPSFSSSSGNVATAYANLYDQTKFRAYNMIISQSNLLLMNRDPKKELKVPCDLTTDYQTPQAQTYSSSNLACGYKGSVGALRICFDAYGKFSPDDCRKPSYKIDADYFNPKADDRIAGIKRFLFHGAPADWSLMSERLAYSLLNQWGIVAPLATHATLYLNGQFQGVFVFVSAIDDMFTQKAFANDYNQGKGGLYKESWFNPVHMRNVTETYKYGKNEDAFMNQIESAMLATPMTEQAATQFFNTYFDVNSLVDVTAANTVLGNTDDWRQRHNLFWYIRDDANGKKAVLIPWDYDRLNDAGADTRGALKGRPWWDPNTKMYCESRLRTAAERGAIKGGSDMAQVAYWTDIFEATPPDVEVPVSCDKIAQLMALALGPRIRQRTRELAATINRASLQASLQTWVSQIQSAVARDPDAAQPADWANEQRSLIDSIVTASQKAVTDANNGDRGVSSAPVASSSGTTFVPKAQATGAVGSEAYKYQPGQVISQTFTPAPGAAAASFLAAGAVPGFVPKSPTPGAAAVSGFVPKSPTPAAVSGFVPRSPTPTLSQQSSTSFPSFPSQSSSSFSSQSSTFPQASTTTFPQASTTTFSQASASTFPSQTFPSFAQQTSTTFPSFSQQSSSFSQPSSFPSFSQPSSSFPSFSQPAQTSFNGASATPSFGAASFSSWQG